MSDEILNKEDYYSEMGMYPKSNLLIGSKYRSTLFENKILTLCLSRISHAYEDKEGTLIVKLRASDIKRELGLKGNSFYDRLDRAAENMTGRTIGNSDPVSQKFDYIAVVDHAHYEAGVLTMEFNRYLNKYLKNIESNYTLMSWETQKMFNSVEGFRLYEVLKAHCYTPKGEPKTNKFRIDISLSELKLLLGVVNAEEDRVKKVLKGSSSPDYDEAVRVAVEKLYSKWYDFKRQVLDIAVQDIKDNKKANMDIAYEALKSGRGGKVTDIRFYVTLLDKAAQKPKQEMPEENSDAQIEFLFELKSVFSEFPDLKLADLKSIAKASDWDMQACKKAAIVASEAGDIDNPVGFIISSIKGNWNTTVKKNKNSFNDFVQRDYNFDELEKKLIAN